MSSEARPQLVQGLVPWESAEFKAGPYPCIGANLAQLELHEALFSLPGLRADGEVVFSKDSMTRRIDAQPLAWDIG